MQKRQDFKNHVQFEISKWLPEEKISQLDTPTDAFNVLRRVGTQKQRSVSYRNKRAYLLAEEIKFKCNEVGISAMKIYNNKNMSLQLNFILFRIPRMLELL